MRRVLLAVALAFGIGFVAMGANAATPGSNVSALKAVAASESGPVVEARYYYRHWRYHHWHHHRYWRRHYYWRHHHHRHWWYRHHHYRYYGWHHRYRYCWWRWW